MRVETSPKPAPQGFAVATRTTLAEPRRVDLSGIVSTPVTLPQLPAAPVTHRDDYVGMGRWLEMVDTSLSVATRDVGTGAVATAQKVFWAKIAAWTGAAAVGAGAFGASWFYVGEPGFGAGVVTITIVSTIAAGVAAALGCEQFAKLIQRNAQNRALAGEKLADFRRIANSELMPLETAALGQRGEYWKEQLKSREIHGWEAAELLTGMADRASQVSQDDRDRAARWSTLRYSVEAFPHEETPLTKEILAAFAALPPAEQKEIAPVVIAELFDGELPRHKALPFEEAKELYATLRYAADGHPTPLPHVPDLAELKAAEMEKAAAEQTAKKLAAQAKELGKTVPAHVNEALPLPLTVVSGPDALTTLDGTLAAFEAELSAILKNKLYVSPESIAWAVAMATAPERSDIERSMLGQRAQRFSKQLDEKEIYGYDVRHALHALAVAGHNPDPIVFKRAVLIDTFHATLAKHAPKGTLSDDSITELLGCVSDMYPADRRAAAQRVLERYFENEVPRNTLDFTAAQRLASGLRAHIRAV